MYYPRTVILLFAAAAALLAADAPYAGRWKMNPAKSDFGQTTVTYEQLPSGEMQATADGLTFKFKTDGKDYPNPWGGTGAWKAVNAATWTVEQKINGKLITTDTLALSSDGKTLTVNSKGTKPNGETMDDTTVLERVSGGPGLAGKWKTKNMKTSSPDVMELTPSGTDGLVIKIVDLGLSCDAKLDGKDYPCSGPTVAAGWTVTLAKSGPRGFDMTTKKDGKALYKSTYSVSSDGKTMTESGSATGVNEKYKTVYDKQ